MNNYRRIGEMLLMKGKITFEQLNAAVQGKNNSRKRIGELLVEMGYTTDRDVAECLAEQFGLELVDPTQICAEEDALKLISGEAAITHRILPVRYSSDYIECVIADPLDFPTTDMIYRMSGKRVLLRLAPSQELVDSIRKSYGLKPAAANAGAARSVRASAHKPQWDREAILSQLEASGYLVGAKGTVN